MTVMHIGNKVDMSEAAVPLADAVVKVLDSIGANRIDREVATAALKVIEQAAGGSKSVNVSHCTLTSNPRPQSTCLYADDD